jgi:branched-subunit amino acid ABC-type transport system permease component
MPTTILTFAVLGAATGALYALGSISLVLVYRSSGVLNFAAGAIGTSGVFAYWDLQVNEHWPVGAAIATGVFVAAVLGAAVGLLMRPLRDASNLTKVVLTLAVLVVLQGLIGIRYPNSYTVNSLLPTGPVHVFGAYFGRDRLALIAIAVVLTLVIAAIYRHTRFGLATSAAAENAEALSTLGWSADRVALVNWATAGALSGFAGILLAPITGVSVGLTTALLLPGLAGAIVGNLQSFWLSLAGALLIGVVQSEVGRYVTLQGAGDAVPFAIILVIIVIRGRKLPLRSYVAERLPRVSSGRVNIPLLIGVAVVGVVAMQWLLSPVWVGAFTYSLIGVILLYSIIVLTGYTGQISLAQWAIAGCGAMVVAQLRVHGLPWTMAVLCGLVAAVPIGLIIGSAAMRARGLSLHTEPRAFQPEHRRRSRRPVCRIVQPVRL